jgi:GTP cyclohydrolase I
VSVTRLLGSRGADGGVRSVVSAFVELEHAVEAICNLPEMKNVIAKCHVEDTPRRVAEAYKELFDGVFTDPAQFLERTFDDQSYDEMVFVQSIDFVSMCAHHWLPFFGKIHFAYIPAQHIVGLSKIPRMMMALAKRPQVQEQLTVQIVNTFQEHVQPKGCGVVIEAVHLCMCFRGAKAKGYTRTHALRGVFKDSANTRQEFLQAINASGSNKRFL